MGGNFYGFDEPSAGNIGQLYLRQHFTLRYYKFVICNVLCGSFRSNGSTPLVLTYWLFNFEANQGMKSEERGLKFKFFSTIVIRK